MPLLQPQSPSGYLIGQAAKLSGVNPANIRFYQKEKLIRRQEISANSYSFYSDEDVHQLRFIRQLRSLDMTLDEVRTLLGLDLRKKRDCQTARDTLDEHIGHVRERLKELRALEKNLIDLRGRCDGEDDHCHLIEALHAQADTAPVRHTGKRHQPL
ncbi:MAG: MerR family transcriptional regulator [Burkholderiales bacterium]|nr:MAG: MerR family transcriptional regulator [Burkholderiales bacterium]